MSAFFDMGGYAIYVWSSYGVVTVVLGGLVVWTLAALKAAARDLNDLEAMAPRRRRRQPVESTPTESAQEETPHAQS